MIRQTFEATEFWRTVLRRSFRLTERTVDLDGGQILLWKHPLHGRWVSTPYRDRLALSWTGDVARLRLGKLLDRPGDIILKDFTQVVGTLAEDHGAGVHLRQQHTNADVTLDESLDGRMNRSARKNWRRATEDYGLKIEIDPKEKFEEFYEIYLDTRHKLGVPPYGRRFFKVLFDHIGRDVVLFRCHDGKTSYGYLLCYLHDIEMISAHIGYVFAHREKRVADFLFMSAFRWGIAKGMRTYRFGGDYNNQTSLIAAKQKLGAVARPQYDLVSVKRKLTTDEADSAVRKILRTMPRPLFRHTGLATQIYFE